MKTSVTIFLSFLLIFVLLVVAMAGCKGGSGEKADKTATPSAPAFTPQQNESADAPGNDDEAKALTSLDVAKLMGNGINLGNTMEAYGRDSLGTGASVSAYETFWGQPVTTREIIHSMKAAGFDSLRIPVAWTNAMNFEKGDYTIREDYLDRVGEIIRYALDEDMYVVVNDHWDGGWWGMFGSASHETRENAMKMYVSMWTQIAEKYKDYPNRLIFESANEELGTRLNDNNLCTDSGTLSEDECYETANRINQAFVDTVRSTGGNNAQRFLLIAGFNTDIVKTCDERFVMPADAAKDKLLLSVHYYTPWGYCGVTSLSKWGSPRDYDEQNDLLSKMKKFTDRGYGVVIGEYTVSLNADGSVKNNACDFFENFLNNCDLYGYVPMLWDCSNLFIRKELGFFDKDVAEVFKSRSLEAQAHLAEDEIKAAAEKGIREAREAAIETGAPSAVGDEKAVAWIMFNSSDYGVTYSVGDVYNPDSITDGVIATDVEITGKGTYTASLDFTGTGAGYAKSFIFSALAITNGEILYPDYVIILIDVRINGESCTLSGKPYTTADDGICTRVNLYNGWVDKIPGGIRTVDGSPLGASATPLNPKDFDEIKTLSVTFKYVPRSELVRP
jgi:endoglucanase